MRRYLKLASTACIAILLSSPLIAPDARSADQAPELLPSAGEEFEQAALDFITWCGPCHGRTGHGNGPVAMSLKTSPPDLTLLGQRAGGLFPTEKVRQRIDGRDLPTAHGTREMPVWGYWFKLQATAGGLLQEDQLIAEKEVDERITRLVTYLKSLQK